MNESELAATLFLAGLALFPGICMGLTAVVDWLFARIPLRRFRR